MSESLEQHDRISNDQRDHLNTRPVSPDRGYAMSDESETSVHNPRESLLKSLQPRLPGLRACVPPMFTESHSTRLESAFQRWKGKQLRPVPKLLVFAVTATIAVMLVILTRGLTIAHSQV